MTTKEKAEQLFQLYLPFVDSLGNIEDIKYRCKKCALITIDEILEIELLVESVDDYYLRYWQEVKQEIEKL